MFIVLYHLFKLLHAFIFFIAQHLLILIIGSDKFVLHPESDNIFFTVDRDLTFEFVKAGTKVSKIVVREHGAIVEEAKAE